jgi:branched-subunit amino acid aminotransferase/4-amino-4-deoxychorismate lyase
MSSVSISEPGEDGPRAWSPRTGRWQTAAATPAAAAFAAVDSWLVDEGRVRGRERHHARFAAAVATAATAAAPGEHRAADVARFLDAVEASMPRTGRWFPRVELTADTGELRLWLRPAPDPLDEVVVYGTPFVDRRRHPRTKGPDFPRQARWGATVEAFDGGEALLSAPAGTVTEGVWTTPVWWDGDVLCALPRAATVLDSVTRALVLDLARTHGVEVGRDTPSVARLRDCETWLLSALHGIRLVTGWLLVPGHEPEPAPALPGRAQEWRARLDALATR